MATPAEIQAQLDSAATGRIANIRSSVHAGALKDNHYVETITGYAGRSMWCATTAAESAANQATEIRDQLASF